MDEASSSSNKQAVNTSSTSTTPNYTHTSGNTSQSMTPSEYGYHHLHRQSNAVSLENSPKSDDYEQLEQVFKNHDKSMGPTPTLLTLSSSKSKSPIKSTINITYNVKSPPATAHENNFFPQKSSSEPPNDMKNLLETSFDESMVYEQIHVFNNTISEINNMLDNENINIDGLPTASPTSVPINIEQSENVNVAPQIVPDIGAKIESKPDSSIEIVVSPRHSVKIKTNDTEIISKRKNSDGDDETMAEQELEAQDSLEMDPNISLYENIQLRKPTAVYENIHMSSNQIDLNATNAGDKTNTKEVKIEHEQESDRPTSFSVRQLANKFQTSPNDTQMPFEFSKPYAKKSNDANRNSPCMAKAKNQLHLNKSAKITRSLDENAFVREFGNTKLQENINRSTHQIPDIKNILSENSPSRRSSIEYTRPKSLNPPKRLPEFSIATNDLCKTDNNLLINFDLKITPTTENPISLIQQNVVGMADSKQSDDEKSLNSISSVKGLGVYKLDRDRIEKIKEERRLQLNEKFRSESFKCDKDYKKIKSKSKTELTDLKEPDRKLRGSLQFKSKSRGEIYNTKDADSPNALALAQSFGCVGRVRRISDEKNQNTCSDEYVATDATMIEETENVAAMSRKFERRPVDIRRDQDGFTTQIKIVNPQ